MDKYLSVPMSQGYKSITLLSTQEQLGKHRFSLERPTIQSGLGIIWNDKIMMPNSWSENEIFQDTFDTTDNKWWILSTLKTAKVCPITFDLCWSPWAFTTDLMVWLNLFISLSNLLVMPTSPKTCKAGDAGLPYSQSLRKKSSIKKVLHFQKRL